ncbi:MAG: metal-dependent hydrolase [Acidobacteria bacterium RIFCSPLOWO2_02_FULL_61_28]|nr:MAG: metal-dependent hydrolase [Acidobacteria bacterium RIFCSPLOWO2_02_FULL_61_28]
MNPVTHLLVGWTVANATTLTPRERALVTVAGIVPDVDGFGMVTDLLTRNSEHPLELWGRFHHVLAHNLGFGLGVGVAAFALSRRRWVAASLALLSFHLHLAGDLVGARGPDGDQWPIPYLSPFSQDWQLTWTGQWALNAWPNFVITGALLLLAFYLAWRRAFSPLELVSSRADRAFVKTLRDRFGAPQENEG